MNLKKAFKIGCLGVLGLFGALLILLIIANIWDSTRTPEERAKADAEREERKRAEIAEDKAEKAQEDSIARIEQAEQNKIANAEKAVKDSIARVDSVFNIPHKYSCDAAGFREYCHTTGTVKLSSFASAQFIREQDLGASTEKKLYAQLFEWGMRTMVKFPCLKRVSVGLYCDELGGYYCLGITQEGAARIAKVRGYNIADFRKALDPWRAFTENCSPDERKNLIKNYVKAGAKANIFL